MSCQEGGRKEKKKKKKKKFIQNDPILLLFAQCIGWNFWKPTSRHNDEMDDSGSSFTFKCKSVMKERNKQRERESVCV
jgi:hypothetical protein